MIDDKGTDPAGVHDPLGIKITTMFSDVPPPLDGNNSNADSGADNYWLWAIAVIFGLYFLSKIFG